MDQRSLGAWIPVLEKRRDFPDRRQNTRLKKYSLITHSSAKKLFSVSCKPISSRKNSFHIEFFMRKEAGNKVADSFITLDKGRAGSAKANKNWPGSHSTAADWSMPFIYLKIISSYDKPLRNFSAHLLSTHLISPLFTSTQVHSLSTNIILHHSPKMLRY